MVQILASVGDLNTDGRLGSVHTLKPNPIGKNTIGSKQPPNCQASNESPIVFFCGILRVTCRMFSDPNRMSGRGASSSSVRHESLGRRRTR